jgi:hypothetical protein
MKFPHMEVPLIYSGDGFAKPVEWKERLQEDEEPDELDLIPASKDLIDRIVIDPDELFGGKE